MNEAQPGLTASCLCGDVRYHYAGELGGKLGRVTQCHCTQCRKAQGGPASVAPASAEALVFTAGRSLVREFESSPGKFRAFCGRCGSPLYSRRTDRPEAVRLRLGAIDQPPATLRIGAHIFFDDRTPWEDSADAAKYPAEEHDR